MNELHGFVGDKPESDSKILSGILHELKVKSKELIANEGVLKALGGSFYSDFLGQFLPIVYKAILKKPPEELLEKAVDLYLLASQENCFDHSQEDAITSNLFFCWISLKPKISTPLHAKGCDLICRAFKKQVLCKKGIYIRAFEHLANSQNIEHLNVAYAKLNEIFHCLLPQAKQSEVVDLFKNLLGNSLLTKSPELIRPMYKALIKLYHTDHSSFELLMKTPGIHQEPDFINGIYTFLPQLKFNGDEALPLELLWCIVESQPNGKVLEGAISLFNAFLKHQADQIAETSVRVSLKTRERIGILAREFLKTGMEVNPSILAQWKFIADQLIAIKEEQIFFFDGAPTNRYKELGKEILCLLHILTGDPAIKRQIDALSPKVVKKTDGIQESRLDKVDRTIIQLVDALSKGSKKLTKYKIQTLAQQILYAVRDLSKSDLETLGKEQHAKLAENIAMVQFLLSNNKEYHIVNLAYKIFDAASKQSLNNCKTAPAQALWIIKGHMITRSDELQMKWTAKLLPIIDIVITAIEDGKKINEDARGIVIEALFLLAKDSYEDYVAISERLLKLCRCNAENEKTRQFLVAAIVALSSQLAKEPEERFYRLGLRILTQAIQHLPIKDKTKINPLELGIFNGCIEYLCFQLPKNWREQQHFELVNQFVEQLIASNYLTSMSERGQYAVISALHTYDFVKHDLIVKLIQKISTSSNFSQKLYGYISYTHFMRGINLSLAKLMDKYFNTIVEHLDVNERDQARYLRLIIDASTGHKDYVRRSLLQFQSVMFVSRSLSDELSNKFLEYFLSCPLEDITDDLVPSMRLIFLVTLVEDSGRFSFIESKKEHKSLLMLIDRLVHSRGKQQISLGCDFFTKILEKCGNCNNESIVQILFRILPILEENRGYEGVNLLLSEAKPILNKKNIKELESFIEKMTLNLIPKLQSDIPQVCSNAITYYKDFFLPLFCNHFPELGRILHHKIVDALIKINSRIIFKMSFFHEFLDANDIYKKMNAGILETRLADESELLVIRGQRQSLEKAIMEKVCEKVSLEISSEADLDRPQDILLRMHQWFSLLKPSEAEEILPYHHMTLLFLLNRSFVFGSADELIAYLQQFANLGKETFCKVVEIHKSPASTPAQKAECLKAFKTLLYLFIRCADHIAALPLLFKITDESVKRLGWKKELFHHNLHEMSVDDPRGIANIVQLSHILDNFFQKCSLKGVEVNFDVEKEIPLILAGVAGGIRITRNQKEYENMIRQARDMALKLTLFWMRECLQIIRNLPLLDKDLSKKFTLRGPSMVIWAVHTLGLVLEKDAKVDFIKKCEALAKEFLSDFFLSELLFPGDKKTDQKKVENKKVSKTNKTKKSGKSKSKKKR